ncbi:hypothetical protein AHF37_09577 [Paragonimus kellicotti]|nr:hypothetical protein AHF37_09577 [Paragonimus kellicotti]
MTPFHKSAFLYGWNQMYFDDEKPNEVQLMQICLDVSRSERNLSYGLPLSGTLLKGLRNWSQFGCQMKTRGSYHGHHRRSRNKQSISLLRINITCVHSWNFDHDKFLVRIEAVSHPPIYLCLRFKLLNELLPVQIFELEESKFLPATFVFPLNTQQQDF